MSKACCLIFWAYCLFAFSSMLTFSRTWASGHRGQAIFMALFVDRRLHVSLLWISDHSGESSVSWPCQRYTWDAGHWVHSDALLGSKYLVKILVWLAIYFRNMERPLFFWALCYIANSEPLYPLTAQTLISSSHINVLYSLKSLKFNPKL